MTSERSAAARIRAFAWALVGLSAMTACAVRTRDFGAGEGGDAAVDGPLPEADGGDAGLLPLARCGDGVVSDRELCDGNDLGAATCKTYGFAGGTLACTVACLPDLSGCNQCGNGTIDPPAEACDGTFLGGATCQDLGFVSGSVTCVACRLDTTGCNRCGDDFVDDDEQCDGASSETCTSLGFTAGNLICGPDCTYDTSACTGGPPGWTCPPELYQAGDGCDCGCGIPDPDCTSAAVDACEFCAEAGSCSPTECPGRIDATHNATCF